MSSVRRIIASIAVAGCVFAGVVVVQATPAFAACVPSFAFFQGFTRTKMFYNTGTNLLPINQWYRGYEVNCGGHKVATVLIDDDGSSSYKISIEDSYCDGIGPYWHAHALGGGLFTFGAGGCKNYPQYPVAKSQIGSPLNWWVEWGGKNSPAAAFP